MLKVEFKRNSDPIDNDELLLVMEAIQSHPEPLDDLVLLLSKMALRIHVEAAKNRHSGAPT